MSYHHWILNEYLVCQVDKNDRKHIHIFTYPHPILIYPKPSLIYPNAISYPHLLPLVLNRICYYYCHCRCHCLVCQGGVSLMVLYL